jgi:hypothetical protein
MFCYLFYLVQGSDVYSPQIGGYRGWDLFLFLEVPTWKLWNYDLKYATAISFYIFLISPLTNHTNIPYCIPLASFIKSVITKDIIYSLEQHTADVEVKSSNGLISSFPFQ